MACLEEVRLLSAMGGLRGGETVDEPAVGASITCSGYPGLEVSVVAVGR